MKSSETTNLVLIFSGNTYVNTKYRHLWSWLAAGDVILESKKESVSGSHRSEEESGEFLLEFLRIERIFWNFYKTKHSIVREFNQNESPA